MNIYHEFNDSEFNRWLADAGDSTLRLNYNLNSDSIVFDLGGFKGEWTEKIYNKYNSNVYVFEPVSEFFNLINSKFNSKDKVKIFHFGLGIKDETLDINISSDQSSVFDIEGTKEKINIKSISDFIKENNINQVDLIKINIEGSEYELLEGLLEQDDIKLFKNIQVQFHRFIPDCFNRRNKIRERLELTHKLTYDYEFLWENWQIKE